MLCTYVVLAVFVICCYDTQTATKAKVRNFDFSLRNTMKYSSKYDSNHIISHTFITFVVSDFFRPPSRRLQRRRRMPSLQRKPKRPRPRLRLPKKRPLRARRRLHLKSQKQKNRRITSCIMGSCRFKGLPLCVEMICEGSTVIGG